MTIERVEQWHQALQALHLTERQLEIAELLMAGMTNQQMADHLHIDIQTVKTHLQHMHDRLGTQAHNGFSAHASRSRLNRRLWVAVIGIPVKRSPDELAFYLATSTVLCPRESERVVAARRMRMDRVFRERHRTLADQIMNYLFCIPPSKQDEE